MMLLPPVTTATLMVSCRVSCLSPQPRCWRPGELRENWIEQIGSFVLNPMTGTRNDLEASIRLDAAQRTGALLEVRVGGGVTRSPDPVNSRPDQWKRAGERVRP
jgi:hypothetical protein